MIDHYLKIERQYYEALSDGLKTFEIRFNDRDYRVGHLIAFRPVSDEDAGDWLADGETWIITYMTEFAQKPGWVVLGVRRHFFSGGVATPQNPFVAGLTPPPPPPGPPIRIIREGQSRPVNRRDIDKRLFRIDPAVYVASMFAVPDVKVQPFHKRVIKFITGRSKGQ